MKKAILYPSLIILMWAMSFAQCDQVASTANKSMKPFLASGQYLRQQVKEGQIVTLKTTLFEGFKYRVVTETDNSNGGRVLYRLLDGGNNIIFTNKSLNSKYWDFEVGSTDNFIFQAKLTSGTGCLVLELGFDDRALGKEEDLEDLDDLDDIDDIMEELHDDIKVEDLEDLDMGEFDDPIFDDEDDLFDDDMDN